MEVNEGLLKKRIIKAGHYTNSTALAEDTVTDLGIVSSWIDEAKKDIFKVQYLKPYHTDPNLHPAGWSAAGYKTSDVPRRGYKKVVKIDEEAVKKWFGDLECR